VCYLLQVSISSVCNYATYFFRHSPATIVYLVPITVAMLLVPQMYVSVSYIFL